MPTTLPMRNRRHLALDRREQVVDVVALEQTLAQRIERRALVLGGRILPLDSARGELRVPTRAQLLQLPLVLLALGLDGRARLLEARAQPFRIGARLAQVANLVQLLV